MLFKKAEDLKAGMRLAKPIYNKNGVLLYERNSLLTAKGIASIRNFGLIGIYILEPAEPVPPMTEEDIKFERFQTMSFFTIHDELKLIQSKKESGRLFALANSIIASYGRLYHKINFIQNLRSPEDYTYKHSLNAAILSALISHQLDFSPKEQLDVVTAALLHDIHKLTLPAEYADKKLNQLTNRQELIKLRKSLTDALAQFKQDPMISANVWLMIRQLHYDLLTGTLPAKAELSAEESEAAYPNGHRPLDEHSLLRGTKVLRAAEAYDSLTAMKTYTEPSSEVSAIRYLQNNPKIFDPAVVTALTDSLHILAPGMCVTLTNQEKGIVIVENHSDVLRPVVLSFNQNKIYDLGSRSVFNKLQILDIMKTLDNRFVIDPEAVANYQPNPSN